MKNYYFLACFIWITLLIASCSGNKEASNESECVCVFVVVQGVSHLLCQQIDDAKILLLPQQTNKPTAR